MSISQLRVPIEITIKFVLLQTLSGPGGFFFPAEFIAHPVLRTFENITSCKISDLLDRSCQECAFRARRAWIFGSDSWSLFGFSSYFKKITIRAPKSTCLPHEKKSLMSPQKTFFVGTQDVAARRVRQEQINQNLYQSWQLKYTHSARTWKNCRLKRIFQKIVIGNLSQPDKTSQVVEAVSTKCRLECVLYWAGIKSSARK